MTKVKICGLKREEDILYVNKLKPDYVGFVFAESVRKVDKYRAKELIQELDRSIKKVGVFLNESMEKVNEIADYCGLDVLQFHGDEKPKYCNSFQYEIWKAFRIKNIESLNEFEKYNVNGFLLDTYIKGEYGGTGKTFHWEMVANISKSKNIILAGGLTPENVGKAINIIHPMVVDVSSGVEVDGHKDFHKMKKFIESVRG